MEIFVWTFIGGIVGALCMDATEKCAAKYGITSGVTVALIGRWFLHFHRGQIVHSNILAAQPHAHEVKVGWAFHFLIGGGGVALIYPLFFRVIGLPMPDDYLSSSVLFGLATSALPWFVLLPAFGWGWCGLQGPRNADALVASTVSHIPYGLGMGVVLTLAL